MLELSTYEIILTSYALLSQKQKAASVLGWVVKDGKQYRLMTKEGVRNIDGYNAKHKLTMPYIVVIVDEMSDLMLVAGKEIKITFKNYLKWRGNWNYIIMATQRPSVDVITGTIKPIFQLEFHFR